ncbi:MAG: type IV toxin-antitoxin system AbiEi family antitoxin domain-containing protein [Solirubrobacterales bacterium]
MGHKSDTPDARVAQIAERQHGVVTLEQLEEAGVTREAAYKRAKRGRLHRLHRGVYAVGHRAPSWRVRWMAAVLACGEGTVLSHHSAAALWELLRPIDGPIHVSVPTTAGRPNRKGIHLHRCSSLQTPAEPSPSPSYLHREGGRGRRLLTTRRHNIPVTTIQRTIDDLEGTVAPYLLRRAKRQAELKGIHLRGVERKRQRSDLEEDFLTLFCAHHFPPFETNVKLGRWEVDFLWRDHNLVVEVDSFAYHRGSVAFEDDYARDLDLRQRGFTVLRFADTQIEEEPALVVADVARALARETG